MGKIRHKPAAETVGEEVDALEWEDPDIHEVIEGGDIVTSNPPSTYHKIYQIYAKKTGNKYHLVMVVDEAPEP